MTTILQIIDVVGNHYRVTHDQMSGEGRTERVAWARHVAMWLSREEGWNEEEIAARFGPRDRSTVNYAVNRIRGLMLMDKTLSLELTHLQKLLEPCQE